MIEHVEEHNCSRGCRNGAKSPLEREVFGPGGTCEILARISPGDGEPILELRDDGHVVTCLVREPL